MANVNYWLIKTEPDDYGFAKLQKEKRTVWTGIRNPFAQRNLREMKPGDLCLFYHTGKEKSVVGIARVVGEPKPDPTAKGEEWSAIDIEPVIPLEAPVSLATIKSTEVLNEMTIVRQGRLSVSAVTDAQFKKILSLGKTKLPA